MNTLFVIINIFKHSNKIIDRTIFLVDCIAIYVVFLVEFISDNTIFSNCYANNFNEKLHKISNKKFNKKILLINLRGSNTSAESVWYIDFRSKICFYLFQPYNPHYYSMRGCIIKNNILFLVRITPKF